MYYFYRDTIQEKFTFRDGLCVRHATESDVEQLANLSKKALGKDYPSDYLVGWLPKAFSDDNRLICVCEKDGVIVSSYCQIIKQSVFLYTVWETGQLKYAPKTLIKHIGTCTVLIKKRPKIT